MTIAFLSTGDELVNGDIQNSTSPQMARELFSKGFAIGNHLMVGDGDEELLAALSFLLSSHDVVICTGGLGPTSDDRTRFALARHFKEELHFFDECWAHIVNRHNAVGVETHENNRQQALFPKQATILSNPFGSACGCAFEKDGKKVFLLPGPPSECMPMFERYVLRDIEATVSKSNPELFRWLVFNMAESQLAHKVEEALADIPCSIGYRLCSPYTELKVSCRDKAVSEQEIHRKLCQCLSSDRVFCGTQTALSSLKAKLLALKQQVTICDEATRGHLESSLSQPGEQKLQFSANACGRYVIKIQGLLDFWNGKASGESEFSIIFQSDGSEYRESFSVHLERRFLMPFVVELLALKIQNWLCKQGVI